LIARVLVVAPASVKYQWQTEIEKFSDLPSQVIDGLLPRRKSLYASPKFFNLTSYELVLKDVRYMQEMAPDLIILDEAQRIRNWTTGSARTIKQLKSRYAFVLTGTPLENKLEELFSVVEFIDGRRLGPAFRFLHERPGPHPRSTRAGPAAENPAGSAEGPAAAYRPDHPRSAIGETGRALLGTERYSGSAHAQSGNGRSGCLKST